MRCGENHAEAEGNRDGPRGGVSQPPQDQGHEQRREEHGRRRHRPRGSDASEAREQGQTYADAQHGDQLGPAHGGRTGEQESRQ